METNIQAAEDKAKWEQHKQVSEKFFDETADTVGNLACRWSDESEYEDINDYKAVLQKEADKHGLKITKISKRPFGFVFQTPYGIGRIFVRRDEVCLSYK